MRVRQVAKGLGLFSFVLGAVELLAPRKVGESMGLERPNLIRAWGLREIAAGAMILSRPANAEAGVWSRVAGDVLDLGTLALAAPTDSRQKRGAGLRGRGAGGRCVDGLEAAAGRAAVWAGVQARPVRLGAGGDRGGGVTSLLPSREGV